ncbi:MAG: sulfotransferase [Gammaproteobacteria bacterium]|nr:sulfotransferase [Gammaproteobacteria bacterium]
MANKRRNPAKKRQKKAASGHRISDKQTARLQQAVHAHSTGQLAVAEAGYRALLAEKVRSPDLNCKLALICARTGRRDEADVLWKNTLAIDPGFLEARMNLADSYQLAGDIRRASNTYRGIIAEHQYFHIAKYLLANILKSQGKLEEASEYYKQVIAQQPDYTQAHFTYSGIHKYENSSDPHFNSMLDLYQHPGLSDESRIHLAFALGKACEDFEDYQRAFEFLKAGNDRRSAEFNYSIESDRSLIQSIIRNFNARAIADLQVNSVSSNQPIFIVGMPRSGTSLVEKILASHSEVHGAGELDYMFALGTKLFLGETRHYEYLPLESYPQGTFETVGKTYLEQIGLLNKSAARVTDKMPFNMMMIGIIKIALPNAKIIHCVRDARDTCLSIYKQNFTTGNYRFAYDLKTVAQFHNEYSALMKHWHETIPDTIYDIHYEALTQNAESEIRKLLATCDLDFEKACIDFDTTRAVVKTASAFQVRQPMYTSSVNLWQSYQPYLGAMLDELQTV